MPAPASSGPIRDRRAGCYCISERLEFRFFHTDERGRSDPPDRLEPAQEPDSPPETTPNPLILRSGGPSGPPRLEGGSRRFGNAFARRRCRELQASLEPPSRRPGPDGPGLLGACEFSDKRRGFASPRLRGEGCRRQQACEAGEGEGAVTNEARRFGPSAFQRRPLTPASLRSACFGRRPKPSPRKRGEADPRLSPQIYTLAG